MAAISMVSDYVFPPTGPAAGFLEHRPRACAARGRDGGTAIGTASEVHRPALLGRVRGCRACSCCSVRSGCCSAASFCRCANRSGVSAWPCRGRASPRSGIFCGEGFFTAQFLTFLCGIDLIASSKGAGSRRCSSAAFTGTPRRRGWRTAAASDSQALRASSWAAGRVSAAAAISPLSVAIVAALGAALHGRGSVAGEPVVGGGGRAVRLG